MNMLYRGYIVVMSSGPNVKIDADEVPLMMAAGGKKAWVQFKNAIVNTAFVISVVPDEDREDRIAQGHTVYGAAIPDSFEPGDVKRIPLP